MYIEDETHSRHLRHPHDTHLSVFLDKIYDVQDGLNYIVFQKQFNAVDILLYEL